MLNHKKAFILFLGLVLFLLGFFLTFKINISNADEPIVNMTQPTIIDALVIERKELPHTGSSSTDIYIFASGCSLILVGTYIVKKNYK